MVCVASVPGRRGGNPLARIIDTFALPPGPSTPAAERLHRSFVTLHVVGPLFGLPICAALLAFDKQPDAVVLAFIVGVCLFALFPFIARGRSSLVGPAFASVQLLAFVSLFGSHFYGGINSPFAIWLIVAGLLSFLFVRPAIGACLAAITVQAGLFLSMQLIAPAEPRLSQVELGILFLISTFAAALYVALIAAFYSRIQSEGSELAALARRYEEAARACEREIEGLIGSNDELSQFFARSSHELRTSLNVVIGYSELLTEDAETGERWARLRNLERVIASSRQMIAVIANAAPQGEAAGAGESAAEQMASADPAQTGAASAVGLRAAANGLVPAAKPEAAWWLIAIASTLLLTVAMKLPATFAPLGAERALDLLLLAGALALGWQAGALRHSSAPARRDPLTGLPNRHCFLEALEGRLGSSPEVAVLFADLDGFREVNDSLGPEVGDALLGQVAARLVAILPPGALLARLGDDEFAIAISGAGSENAIRAFADRLFEAMAAPFVTGDDQLAIGASIGLAHGESAAITAGELLRRSEIAMYRAKGDEKGAVQSFEAQMDETLTFRRTMRQDLTQALCANELDLHLQPVVDARTGAIASAEALLRWTHPVLGPVSPAKLVTLAEESGQIVDIDDWVLDRALAYARQLRDIPLAVNISPVHFRHPNFARKIVDRLAAGGVPAHLLRLEITEGVLVTHTRAASRAIAELREAGIKIALDDFGTGFSSLSYLRDLGFDLLKVDRSFVVQLEKGRQGRELLRAIVDLGHSLDMAVIAEGVETAAQAGLVQLLGCDFIQGYFTGRPMSVTELAERAAAVGAGAPGELAASSPGLEPWRQRSRR